MTKNTLGQLLKSVKPMSMEDQYAGVLSPDRIPKAKEILAELGQIIAKATPQNSCGTANRRLSMRQRLLKEQILRSEQTS